MMLYSPRNVCYDSGTHCGEREPMNTNTISIGHYIGKGRDKWGRCDDTIESIEG